MFKWYILHQPSALLSEFSDSLLLLEKGGKLDILEKVSKMFIPK